MALEPSPNCHHQVVTVPSGSVEPEPSNETATLALPVRSGPAFATGGWFGFVVLVVELVDVDVDEVEVLVLVLRDVDVELLVEVDVELLVELDVDVVVDEDVLVVEVVGLPPPPLAAHADEQATSARTHTPRRRTLPVGRLILRLCLLHTCRGRLRGRAGEQAMCRRDRSCAPESHHHHHPPPRLRQAFLARSVNAGLPVEGRAVNATEVVSLAQIRAIAGARGMDCASTTSCKLAVARGPHGRSAPAQMP